VIVLDKLGFSGRAMVWLNEVPNVKYVPIETMKTSLPATSSEIWDPKKISLEYYGLVDHSRYGFLGLDYEYQKTNTIEINVLVGKDKDSPFKSPILGKYGKGHIGIPKVYADAVFKVTMDILLKTCFPAGILTFGIGAHDELGSSQFMFSQITHILMKIVAKNLKNITEDNIKEIILAQFVKNNS
jgi:hypothetical protein